MINFKPPLNLKKIVIGGAIGLIVLATMTTGAIADRLFGIKPLDVLFPRQVAGLRVGKLEQKVLTEESVVINVAEKVSPSVVTVTIEARVIKNPCLSMLLAINPGITHPITLNSGDKGKINGNKDLSISTQAKVLSLAYFSTITRIDPIFAIEGTEPEILKINVEMLKKDVELMSTFYTDPIESSTVREVLYPITFLSELAVLEEIRLKFLVTATDEIAKQYVDQLNRTNEAYVESAERL